jgi:hypothetical protein
MSVQLRWEQCCATQDCTRPANGGAGERAPDAPAARAEDVVDPAGAAWLRELWAA